MFRYMAFVWNGTDRAQTQLAERLTTRFRAKSPSWQCALEQPGVRVYYTGDRSGRTAAYRLCGGRGVVLGTLFRHSPDTSPIVADEKVTFDAQTSARIVATGGRELISGYWGNYVAVVHDASRNMTWVVRGPASTLPCLLVTHHRVGVYFSFMDDCMQLDLCRFSINWEYLAVDIVGSVSTEHTGLHEVSQVRPGECIESVNSRVSTRVYWDALDVARTEVIENTHEATAALRRAVRTCVHAWAACHKSIVHCLSGGLDSSIVLACLKAAPTRPRITCLTQYSLGPDSDEREYARLAAQHSGSCAHVEQRRNSGVRLETMLGAALSPIPQGTFRRVQSARTELELAIGRGATAIFSGYGGDALFFQNEARLTVADFVHRHGIRRRLARIAYDAAQLEGLSIWRLLLGAFYNGLVPHHYNPLAEALRYSSLVTTDVVHTVRMKNAPWSQSTRKTPAGKLWHAYGISCSTDYYDPMGQPSDPELISPLLSQPLIEVALRIPTYVLMVGGWDRGLARRAFADELPLEIARRRSKGGMAECTLEVLQTNLPFVRELLLDGQLVQHGLLDREKVAEALADRPSGVMKGVAAICEHLDREVWLRMWTDQWQRAAA